MTIDDPILLKEITAAFQEYERALMEDDIPAMDALFHDAPTTNRYGVSEVLYGIEEIREFRKGRGEAALPAADDDHVMDMALRMDARPRPVRAAKADQRKLAGKLRFQRG